MNLFELFVKIGVDDQASGNLSRLSSSLGKGLATAAKIGTAAVSAAAAGITALTKAAVDNYAEYEQLVGGVETLFKTSSDTVMKYAENAYKTAGMSANEYMATVTGFSAAMIQSLGGDTAKAAELSNMALTDMSDNANKMGSDLETLKTAYAGFSKQNYTMLDNLKLGYGGTKTEMERLIADAAKLDESINANDMSFANIVKAINVVQTEMGITGTTAKEAGSTIQGSVGMMKSAWQNLVTGIADENANLDVLLTNLVDSVGTVAENLIPKVEVALGSIASLIEKLAPVIVEALPSLVSSVVPSLISAATGMVNAVIAVLPDLLNTVVGAIIDNAPALIDSAIVLIGELSSGILSQLPKVVKLGLDLIVSLANGIAESLPELIPTIVGVIVEIVNTLTNPETLGLLLGAAIAILTALSESLLNPDTINQLLDAAIGVVNSLVSFLMQNLSPLLNAAIDIIMALVSYILDPSNLAKLVQTAIQLVVTIAGALVGAAGELLAAAGTLILELIGKFKETDWSELGKNLVDGFKQGIQNAWSNLKEWFEGLFDDLVGVAKRILGIASPSKVFKKIGAWSAEGFGIGWEDEFDDVARDIEGSLNFGGYDYEVVYEGNSAKVGANGVVSGSGVTVIQNIYSEAKTAADLMQEAIYQQERAVLLGV